jgi:tryptophan 2-monooxygenase
MSGMVAAYELMKMGLRPVVYEASHMGGRLRSQQFRGCAGRRDRRAGRDAFPGLVDLVLSLRRSPGADTAPFPNPLAPGSDSTVIHIEGTTHYAEQPDTLPTLFQEVAQAWADALEAVGFTKIQDAIRARDVASLKSCGTS